MNQNNTNNPDLTAVQQPKKLGPCCVCKDTRKLRDECFFAKSEEECIN